MFVLQLLLNNTLFNHINEDNNLYNKELFYGTIISDIIQNDTTFNKTNLNHDKVISYWKGAEMYEGMEIQLFPIDFFIELHGIYYDNKFFTLEEWINESKKYIDIIKTNKLIYKPISLRGDNKPTKIEEYNLIINSIVTYQKFIINLVNNNTYYSKVNNNYIDMFININSWLHINKNDIIFNNIVNDFILNLLNLIPVLDTLNTYFDERDKKEYPINFDTFSVRGNKFFYKNTLEKYRSYIINLYNEAIPNTLVKFFYLIIIIALGIFKQTRTTTEPLLIIFNHLSKNINNLNLSNDFIQYLQPKINNSYRIKYLKYKNKYLKYKNK